MNRLQVYSHRKPTDTYILIDPEDYEMLKGYRWTLNGNKNRKYPVAWKIHKSMYEKIYLHRLVMNCPDGKVVDHINHDTLDNRKSNLRVCTTAENLRNSRVQKNNSTGYKGVAFEYKRYHVRIQTGANRYYLGSYPTVTQASAVYQAAAISLFGEFACGR